jgi:hypothetical protein
MSDQAFATLATRLLRAGLIERRPGHGWASNRNSFGGFRDPRDRGFRHAETGRMGECRGCPFRLIPSVGHLDWGGAWHPDRGPVLARGSVEVPNDVEIELNVAALTSTTPHPRGSWGLLPDYAHPVVDLEFLVDLPAASITSLSLGRIDPGSMAVLPHLAVGLRRFYMGRTAFSDEVLPFVAQLTNLTYLQTFGNHFTDRGVQQLRFLTQLRALYLEEATLTFAAFAFVGELPLLPATRFARRAAHRRGREATPRSVARGDGRLTRAHASCRRHPPDSRRSAAVLAHQATCFIDVMAGI